MPKIHDLKIWPEFYEAIESGVKTFDLHPREGGYTFVTCPDFPGFSFMLEPGQGDTNMNAIFVQFLAYNMEAARAIAAPQS